MQIKIDLKILIFVLIFLLTGQLKIYILLMIFAFIHEIGHLICGMVLGFKPYIFQIRPIGFSISFYNSVEDYNKKILKSNILELKKIVIYLCGPFLNFLLAIIISHLNIGEDLKMDLIYVNLILATVNLLPIYPLDGGRILKGILCLFFGLKKSYIYIEKVSNIFLIILLFISSILILYIHNTGLVIMLIYLLYIKIKASRIIEKKINLYKLLEKCR